MDDFLHNLRSGKLKQPERGRRDFTDFKGNQRRTGSERRRTDYYAKVTNENFALVKDSLALLAQRQHQISDALIAGNTIDLRIAEALEAIAVMMARHWGYPDLPAQDGRPADAPLKEQAADAALAQTVDTQPESRDPGHPRLGDEDRSGMLDTIAAMRAGGESWEKIARHLEDRKCPTLSGKGKWRGPAVKKFWDAHIDAA